MDKLRSIETTEEIDRPKTAAHLSLDCPPLPHTLFEAMGILDRPGALGHDRVSAMIQNDPLVVVRLLRIVNSPFYGFSRSIDSADRAVRLLGPSAVAGIVMGMNVSRLQTILEGPASKTLERLIHHGVATSRLGQWLWDFLCPGTGGQEASTAGLLHDFGKIVLLYNYPEAAFDLYDGEERRDEAGWLKAEFDAFGCNHLEAGERIADRLEFPPGLMSVIRRASSEDGSLKTVIALADVAAAAIGFHFEQPIEWEECQQHHLWDELAGAFPSRAGDKKRMQRKVAAQAEEVARYVLQLSPKAADRSR